MLRKRIAIPLVLAFVAALVGVVGSPASAVVFYGRFTNAGSNKCLDMKDENRFTIQQWTCSGGDDNQAWQLVFFSATGTTNPQYQFVNKKSGLCMGVQGDSVNAGAQVITEQCAVDAGQLFATDNRLVNGQLQSTVVSFRSGLCLDVRNGSHDNGAIVQQYTCNGTPAQVWLESNF